MFIVELNLKRFLARWKRTAVFVCLAALITAGAGLAADRMLRGQAGVDPVSIIITDEDNTFESRAFYTVLTGVETYKGFILFDKLERGAAMERLNANEATAIFVIPRGFTENVKSGLNTPFQVVFNASSPLKAGLVRYYGDAFTAMLAASQAGVYAGLDYARAHGTAEDYNRMFRDVNLRYLSVVGSREDMAVVREASATGGVGLFTYYTLQGWVFIMMAGVALFADIFQANFSRAAARRLALGGTGTGEWVAANVFSLAAMLLCVNGALGLLACGCVKALGISLRLSPLIVPAALLLALCAAAFGVVSALIFNNVFSEGVGVSVFALASLFLSGGIVPPAFLPDALALPARFTLNYWAVKLLAGCFAGEADIGPALPMVIWLVCCACAALALARARSKAGGAL